MSDSNVARVCRAVLAGLLAWACFALSACASHPAPRATKPASEAPLPPSYAEPAPVSVETSVNQPSSQEIPITSHDIVLGNADAPVTIVAFSDIECPFCLRALPTLTSLRDKYGAQRLRIVVKHLPLSFHAHARGAAEVTQAVLALGGSAKAFEFMSLLMNEQSALGPELYARAAERVGLSPQRVTELAQSAAIRAQVDEHLQQAQRIGALGTPNFRINGAELEGAQPLPEFVRVIDAELAAADKLATAGTPAAGVYQVRVTANFKEPKRGAQPASEPSDEVTHFVPLGRSLVKGPKDAPVTIVEFTDFECAFCRRAHVTVREVLERYPGRVRLVLKHNPLPFHVQAQPAAKLVIEARAQRGDAVAWQAVDRIFEAPPPLSEAFLLELARELKLNEPRVKGALARSSQPEIAADQALALDLQARGTPQFFINGRRLVGAQPVESFTEAIDGALARSSALMEEKRISSAQVYDVLMKTAVRGEPPERKQLPAPSASQPSRGPVNAPVVIQSFSDFQCPFCKRVLPTLQAIEKRYAGKVRFVWHDLPLPFHQNARNAAFAAREAFAQRGAPGFWQMHDKLFANQTTEGGLEPEALERYAAELGLDVARFKSALSDGRHEAAIAADEQLAQQNDISGTPSFVVGDYYVSGAQPEAPFARAIDLALADAKAKRKKPAAPSAVPAPK